jgi:hypothetical protein
MTSTLGVEEVRPEPGCIVIFTRGNASEEDLDAVRLLARAEWPALLILVSRRLSIRDSGVRHVVYLDEPTLDAPPSSVAKSAG